MSETASYPHPRRQNSAVSSTSSGNRTIRANSQRGRRRSSASNNNPTSSFFERLTGRTRKPPSEDEDEGTHEINDADHDDDETLETAAEPSRASPLFSSSNEDVTQAGPSDYWRRTPSPPSGSTSPPVAWRQLATDTWRSDVEDGPSDVWRSPTPPFSHSPPYLARAEPDAVVAEAAERDDLEYERRMNGLSRAPGQGRPTTPRGVFEGVSKEPDNEKAAAERDLGEPEFDQLERDEGSDRTPSTTAPSVSSSHASPVLVPPLNARKSYLDPSVSRLRSMHLRNASSSTQASLSRRPSYLEHSRAPSHFSQISMTRSDSMSTTLSSRPMVDPPVVPQIPETERPPAFAFHPLRQLSAHLFARRSSGTASPTWQSTSRKAGSLLGLKGPPSDANTTKKLGKPTVMDVRGMIAVGTEGGYIVVYGFGQELKQVLGTEATASSGAVTALTISADQTYIAAGHSSGDIYLWDLATATRPARTTLALSLNQIHSGRREGHLRGSRIVHLGFVGARHTAIISGDEHGRAFWWSLGKVLGVESNDVVRMLGSYPEPLGATANGSAGPSLSTKRPTTLFAAQPLPMGVKAHPTDQWNLSCLLTPVKLVIVGMKPTAKTWYRKMRESAGGEYGGFAGCAAWLASGEVGEESDPVLAYSWGSSVRFLRVKTIYKPTGTADEAAPGFEEGRSWEAQDVVKAMQWYDTNHLLLITSYHIVLLDVRTMAPVEGTPLQTSLLTGQSYHSGLSLRKTSFASIPESLVGSVKTHRGKLFLLTRTNVQVGSLSHWNDSILAKVHQGDFLGAIRIALAYYEDRPLGNTIGLPLDAAVRRKMIATRIRELMSASLEWAFSEDRMRDDTHYSVDGRGVDLTSLFEGLATSCIEACLSIGDTTFLFEEAYERYVNAGIQGIFLTLLEARIFEGKLQEVPPAIIKGLMTAHDERGEFDLAEAVIWHIDPMALDINQAVRLCERHRLWDALIHVYTRAMRDYVAPMVKLIGVVREVQRDRVSRPALVNGHEYRESQAPDAYKLYAYIETTLSGLAYPSGQSLVKDEAISARAGVYDFLFSGRTVSWPDGADGEPVLVSDGAQPPYPYLDLVLRFDTEAFLHAMDIAFEDSYLNDHRSAVNRQTIVNLMLDVMDPEAYHSGDITLLHIFVARNLPKYPQFLFIPPSTLHRILVSLASDVDQSSREDRQLAAEYLLSAYTPHDLDAMLALFEDAGFFRILRAAYRRDCKWAALISTLLRDPESDDGVFADIDDIVRNSSRAGETKTAVQEAIPQLLDLNIRQTALLLDKDLPELHDQAIQSLASGPHKQMAYLRCLLEPTSDEADETGPLSPLKQASNKLDITSRHLYVRLLSQHDPSHGLDFLEARGPKLFDLDRLVKECESEGYIEGQLWALDQRGNTDQAMQAVADILRENGANLAEALIELDQGVVHLTLDKLHTATKMAVRLCLQHSAAPHIEDMWFDVLREVINLVHQIAGLHGNGTAAVDSLRSLVQETLSSFVSSSSASLSFPRLFKRLIEASGATNKAKKGRAYSEFRTILTGMLDGYRAEGEMLGMTTRLVEAELFISVKEVTEKRQQGWRPDMAVCDVCGDSLFAHAGRENQTRQAVVVLGSGRSVHRGCFAPP